MLPSAVCLEVKETLTLLRGTEDQGKGQDERVTCDIKGNFNFKHEEKKKIFSVIALRHSNGLSKQVAEFPSMNIFRPQCSKP